MPDYRVVDTDVVSFLFKGDTRAADCRRHLNQVRAVVSFMTVAKLERWAIQSHWGEARRRALELEIASYIVVFPDRRMCRLWAEVTHQARRNGRPIQTADAWIAATAIRFGVPLVTNNRNDFAGVNGLTILDQHST